MKLIIVSGLSGSGKSIALETLEDCGYYCIDNLPVTLLEDFISHVMLADKNTSAIRELIARSSLCRPKNRPY
jgi:UPF0042 nucleotide-binding protein